MILYASSVRLVANNSQLKIIIPAETYSINEFSKKIKIAKPMWVSPQIKDYKLLIFEHHTVVSSTLLFKTLGINANFLTKIKSSLTNGEYQTDLKPLPKKIAFHCKEIEKFHNEIWNLLHDYLL